MKEIYKMKNWLKNVWYAIINKKTQPETMFVPNLFWYRKVRVHGRHYKTGEPYLYNSELAECEKLLLPSGEVINIYRDVCSFTFKTREYFDAIDDNGNLIGIKPFSHIEKVLKGNFYAPGRALQKDLRNY